MGFKRKVRRKRVYEVTKFESKELSVKFYSLNVVCECELSSIPFCSMNEVTKLESKEKF